MLIPTQGLGAKALLNILNYKVFEQAADFRNYCTVPRLEVQINLYQNQQPEEEPYYDYFLYF